MMMLQSPGWSYSSSQCHSACRRLLQRFSNTLPKDAYSCATRMQALLWQFGRTTVCTVHSKVSLVYQVLCQRRVALDLVEPRSALVVLEYADVAGAHLLRSFCFAVALSNLDAVILEVRTWRAAVAWNASCIKNLFAIRNKSLHLLALSAIGR